MRKSIEIGDEITTIGGIIGKVVSIKEESDSLVLETASDKIRIKKWAIAATNSQKKSIKIKWFNNDHSFYKL